MLSPRRAYTLGAGSVFFSRAISTLAGVISLWLLSRILNTDAFAHYIVTMSIVVLGGYLAGLGLERSMLLRIAQLRSEHGQLLGRGMMLKIAALALVLSMLVAGGLVHYFTSMAAHDGLGMWVRWMVAIVPATAISLVLIVWFRANHLVGAGSGRWCPLSDSDRCLPFCIGPAVGCSCSRCCCIPAAYSPDISRLGQKRKYASRFSPRGRWKWVAVPTNPTLANGIEPVWYYRCRALGD